MNSPIPQPPKKSSMAMAQMRGIRIGDLIEKLTNAKKQHGDLFVMMTVDVMGANGEKRSMIKAVWKGDIGLASNGERVLVLQPGGESTVQNAPLVGG